MPQSAPSQPGSQMHCPWKHTPWPLQDLTHPPASKRADEMGVERSAFAAGPEMSENTDAVKAGAISGSTPNRLEHPRSAMMSAR